MTVLYFDDPMFDRITDQTRVCNECRTCFCGGRGERIRIDAPCCFNLCLRSSCPCPCVPVCCPTFFCPCVLRNDLFLEDAQKGMFEIKKARDAALKAVANSYGNSSGSSHSNSHNSHSSSGNNTSNNNSNNNGRSHNGQYQEHNRM